MRCIISICVLNVLLKIIHKFTKKMFHDEKNLFSIIIVLINNMLQYLLINCNIFVKSVLEKPVLFLSRAQKATFLEKM